MKSWKILAAAFAISAGCLSTASAAEKWDMALIGKMTLPQNVVMQEGEQQALPFAAAKSPKWFFTKKGITDGHFYTLTAKDGPDYTYGWAFSAPIGAQYMLEAGIGSYKGKTPVEQMDLIAAHLNQKLAAEGAEFSGAAPLVKIADKKKSPLGRGFHPHDQRKGYHLPRGIPHDAPDQRLPLRDRDRGE